MADTTSKTSSNSTSIFQNMKQKWAVSNKFNVDIKYTGGKSELVKMVETDGGSMALFTSDDITPYVIDIQIPDLANETIEEWVVNEYRVAMGRNSIEQVQVKFRDVEGFPLYNTLKGFIRRSTEFFPADCYWQIAARQATTNIHTYADAKTGSVFYTHKAILTSLSGLTFSQGTDEIAEFSATWKVGTVTGV